MFGEYLWVDCANFPHIGGHNQLTKGASIYDVRTEGGRGLEDIVMEVA